jgi:hypothetical protein
MLKVNEEKTSRAEYNAFDKGMVNHEIKVEETFVTPIL